MPIVAPGETSSANRAPLGTDRSAGISGAAAGSSMVTMALRLYASKPPPAGTSTCSATRPRTPRTAQPRTMPSEGATSGRPGSAACMIVHAGEAPPGAPPSQSTPATSPGASALPTASAPAGTGGAGAVSRPPSRSSTTPAATAAARAAAAAATAQARPRAGGRRRASAARSSSAVAPSGARPNPVTHAWPSASTRMSRSVSRPWTAPSSAAAASSSQRRRRAAGAERTSARVRAPGSRRVAT